jgi:hypothetical protein
MLIFDKENRNIPTLQILHKLFVHETVLSAERSQRVGQ